MLLSKQFLLYQRWYKVTKSIFFLAENFFMFANEKEKKDEKERKKENKNA